MLRGLFSVSLKIKGYNNRIEIQWKKKINLQYGII